MNLHLQEAWADSGLHPAAVNPNGRSGLSGWRPLHHAAASGERDMVDTLLRRGAQVDGAAGSALLGTCTALHVAAAHGHVAIARRLLRAGAGPDRRDEAGFTPLHIAACRGDSAMIRALIHGGACPEAMLADHTPLDLARQGGHCEAVGLLRQVTRRLTVR